MLGAATTPRSRSRRNDNLSEEDVLRILLIQDTDQPDPDKDEHDELVGA